MEDWNLLMKDKVFITDLGVEPNIEIKDNESEVMGRYAVWSPVKNQDFHKIIEIGSDLNQLATKYNVSSEFICCVKNKEEV